MPKLPILMMAAAPLLLGGCLARTAIDVVTAPVRVASSAVDLVTTSQSEADEKRGREMRRQDEEIGQIERDYEDLADACDDGNQRACRDAARLRLVIDDMRR